MYKPTISKPMFSYCCVNTYYPQTAKITLAIFSIPVRVQQRFFNLLQSDSVTIFCTSYQKKKKKSSFSKWTISIDISSFLRPLRLSIHLFHLIFFLYPPYIEIFLFWEVWSFQHIIENVQSKNQLEEDFIQIYYILFVETTSWKYFWVSWVG